MERKDFLGKWRTYSIQGAGNMECDSAGRYNWEWHIYDFLEDGTVKHCKWANATNKLHEYYPYHKMDAWTETKQGVIITSPTCKGQWKVTQLNDSEIQIEALERIFKKLRRVKNADLDYLAAHGVQDFAYEAPQYLEWLKNSL